MYQYRGNWFAAVSCVCIRDRLRIVGHLQQRMKMENRRRVSVMELIDEMFWNELMNNSDVVQVQRQMINSVQRWILYCCMDILVKTVLLFKMLMFQPVLMQHFRHPSTSITFIHLPHLQPDQRGLVRHFFNLINGSTGSKKIRHLFSLINEDSSFLHSSCWSFLHASFN